MDKADWDDSQNAILEYAREVDPWARTYALLASKLNDFSRMRWPLREQLRTIEGTLDRVHEACSRLLAGLGMDEADTYLADSATAIVFGDSAVHIEDCEFRSELRSKFWVSSEERQASQDSEETGQT